MTEIGRIGIISRRLLVVRGLVANYDLSPEEAVKGFVNDYSAKDYALLKPRLWKGDRLGTTETASVYLFLPANNFLSRSFTTRSARRGLTRKGIDPAMPVDLVSLARDVAIRHELFNMEIRTILALGHSDNDMHMGFGGRREAADLSLLGPDECEMSFVADGFGWSGVVIAGIPQVSSSV